MPSDIGTFGEDHLSPEKFEVPKKGEISEALRSRLAVDFPERIQAQVAESEPPPGIAEVRRMLSVIKESMSDLSSPSGEPFRH